MYFSWNRLLVLVLAGIFAACGGDGGRGKDVGDAVSTEVSAEVYPEAVGETGADDVADNEVQPPPPLEDFAGYVDPMIGSKGSGNVIPGPSLPHGMVKLSPDSEVEVGSVDGYEYGSPRIEGFSHTHLEGPGGSGNGYSEILVVPTTGTVIAEAQWYASTFSHDSESASPGYYSVTLDDHGVTAELTATHRCGVHRYHYLPAEEAHLLIDLGHTRGESKGGKVEVVGDDTIVGYGMYAAHPVLQLLNLDPDDKTSERTVFFFGRVSVPFESHTLWQGVQELDEQGAAEGADLSVALNYSFPEQAILELRLCISFIDAAQAEATFGEEVEGKTFDEVAVAAKEAWNEVLNRVRVEGGTEDDMVKFYTALYHSLLQPVDYTEGERFWCGTDGEGKVFEDEGFRFYADDWCMWDTFRTSHPLQTLVEPERAADKVQSYVHMYEQGGWLPKCPWQAKSYSRVMIGNHSICFLADAWNKGIVGFDQDSAWEGVLKNSMEDDLENIPEGFYGYGNYGTLPSYISKGYVPNEEDPMQSVSLTLEFAYNDWCAATIAAARGDEQNKQYFIERSKNYENHWDAETGFMRPKLKNGTWLVDFDPTQNDQGFCEADSWIYTWFVPHDPAGLIALFGGDQPFTEKLDTFFGDGHYDSTNQPDFHTSFLYTYASKPASTQAKVTELMGSEYDATPGGLPGNDDAGATSAWYVLSALGLYPVAPGSPVYVISAPVHDRAEIYTGGPGSGAHFTIIAEGNSAANMYIQSATLDGDPYDQPWITHADLLSGGTLVLQMGSEPSDWGSANPPSSQWLP